MSSPAVLSVFQEGDSCYFTWQGAGTPPGPALLLARQPWSPEVARMQRAELDRAATLLGQRILRLDSAASTNASSASDSLVRIARLICNRLPPVVAQALHRLPAGSSLLIDASDPELPWELAHDGEDYLAFKFAVARRLLLPIPPRQNPVPLRQEPVRGRFTALIIGNPTGDLPGADREVEELVHLLQATPGTSPPRILMRHRATRSAVLGELASGSYDLVHYSGHAFFDLARQQPTAPATCGLVLANGEVLAGAEIEKNLGGRPFVFLNGCDSAVQTSAPTRSAAGQQTPAGAEGPDGLRYLGPNSAGLAAAFIEGGAWGAAGALWPVPDDNGPRFVLSFYQAALRGVPIGEAMRQARRATREADPGNLLWASFTLYGDPDVPLLVPSRFERRPVTVLVARVQGLEGPPAMGSEETALLGAQVESLAEIIGRYGGRPLDLERDCLTGVFGLPATRENDPECAVRAALEIIAAGRLAGANSPASSAATPGTGALGIAVGLATGEVLANAAGGASHRVTLLGGPVHEAFALAGLAGDGEILAAESVQRHLGALFDMRPASPKTGPVEDLPASRAHSLSSAAYQVLGLRVNSSRTPDAQAYAPGRQAQLIGRANELAMLEQSWRACCQGRGRVVSIAGEAGSGKSRLLYEFRRQFETDGARWLAAACPSSYLPGPYELVAALFRELLGLPPAMDAGDAGRQLAGALHRALAEDGTTLDLAEDLAVLGEILPAAQPDARLELPGSRIEPRARQRRIVALLGRLLSRCAERQPLIIAVDDLHWADDASLEVLNQLAGGFDRLPVLLIALFRSETSWQPPWWPRQNHHWLRLAPLGEDESGALLAALFAPQVVPAGLSRAIVERAGGNPFFLRELTLALQDSTRGLESPEAVQAPPLPGTVQRLILARLDRLPEPARRVLPVAAVAGDQADVEVLGAALAETGDDDALDEGLGQLEAREFLHRPWGEPSYRFTHALLREVAYGALDGDTRRRIHLRLGRAFERIYAGREREVLDLLAHHFDRSDDRLAALRYGLQAARHAAETWANTLALSWYGRALARLESFAAGPPSEAEEERGASQQQLLSWRVEAIEGQAGVEAAVGRTEAAVRGYTEALRLVSEAPVFPVERQADLYRKLAIVHHDRGDLVTAGAALEQGLAVLGGRAGLEAGRLRVWRGLLCFRRGELGAALAACDDAIAILASVDSRQDLAQVYNLQGLVYRNMGQSKPAIEAHQRSVALYRAAGDSAGLERATSNLGCVYQDLGRWPEALGCFEASAGLAERTGETRRQAAAQINLGEIYRRQGDLVRAVAAYERARQVGEEFGFPEATGMALMDLGATYLKQDDLARAGECLDQGLALFQRIGADVYLPEILRYQAELQLQAGHPSEALPLAQGALDWATKLARRLELGQAHSVMGEVLAALGRPDEAATAFQAALSILESEGNAYEVALTWAAFARFLAAQPGSAREQARAACDRAIEVFDELGASLDAARARELRTSL